MNMVKVYNAKGEHVDSFRKPVKKEHQSLSWKYMIAALNNRGFYIRSQFSHSGKTLRRTY